MDKDEEYEKALRAIAAEEGKTVEEVKLEMLLEHARKKRGAAPEPRREIVRGTGDASGAELARHRSEAVQRHNADQFPGSPVVRYARDPYKETAEEARERWLEEEAELPDGVHGLGGQTAGGIFGQGAIATSIYDPDALARGDQRVGQMANIKMLGIIERLERRLTAAENAALPPAETSSSRRLGRRQR